MAVFDVFKHDPDLDFLVIKAPKEDFNKGSKLIVQEGQWALVVENGELTLFDKPGNYTLDSKNIVLTKGVKKLFTGGTVSNHNKVYFINAGKSFKNLKWKTADFEIQDSVILNYFHFDIAGVFSAEISPDEDSIKKLLKIVPENQDKAYFSCKDLTEYYLSVAEGFIRTLFSKTMVNKQIPYGEIHSFLENLNAQLSNLSKQFEEIGLKLTHIQFNSINIADKDREKFERHCSILEHKFKQDALGIDYSTERILDALNKQAENSASGALANPLIGAGVGLAAGQIYTSKLNDFTDMTGPTVQKNNDAGIIKPHNLESSFSFSPVCSCCGKELEPAWTHCPFCGNKI